MLDNQRRRCLPQRWLFVRSGERGAWVHPQIAVLETAGAQGSGRTRDGRVGGGGGDAVRADLPLIE
jgi:hypothetical protein